MRVIDVQASAVGQDHVGKPEILIRQGAGIGHAARPLPPAHVAQWRLLLEIPAGTARWDRGGGVGVHDLGGREHRIGVGLAEHRYAVLDLGPHDPAYAHGTATI